MRKILLIILIFLTIQVNAFSGMHDAFDRAYWVSKSGLTAGSVNDIMFKYFGTLGYAGDLNDRYHSWLVDQTGLSSSLTLNDLLYQYFVLGTVVAGNTILMETGSHILLETGDKLLLE